MQNSTQLSALTQGPVLENDFKVTIGHLFIDGLVNGGNPNAPPPNPITYRWKFRTDAKIQGISLCGRALIDDPSVLTLIRVYDSDKNIIWCSQLVNSGNGAVRSRMVPFQNYLPVGRMTPGDIPFPLTADIVIFFNETLGVGDPDPTIPPPDGCKVLTLFSYPLQDPRNAHFIRADGEAKGNPVNGEVKSFGKIEFQVGHTQFPYQNLTYHSTADDDKVNLFIGKNVNLLNDLCVGFFTFNAKIPTAAFSNWGNNQAQIIAPTKSWVTMPNGAFFVNHMQGQIIYQQNP